MAPLPLHLVPGSALSYSTISLPSKPPVPTWTRPALLPLTGLAWGWIWPPWADATVCTGLAASRLMACLQYSWVCARDLHWHTFFSELRLKRFELSNKWWIEFPNGSTSYVIYPMGQDEGDCITTLLWGQRPKSSISVHTLTDSVSEIRYRFSLIHLVIPFIHYTCPMCNLALS